MNDFWSVFSLYHRPGLDFFLSLPLSSEPLEKKKWSVHCVAKKAHCQLGLYEIPDRERQASRGLHEARLGTTAVCTALLPSVKQIYGLEIYGWALQVACER